jgi:hypothetical protein
MQLANEVHAFTSACERLLGMVAIGRPLTHEEMKMVEYYCQELLNKLVRTEKFPPST